MYVTFSTGILQYHPTRLVAVDFATEQSTAFDEADHFKSNPDHLGSADDKAEVLRTDSARGNTEEEEADGTPAGEERPLLLGQRS